jgi:thiol-disulfide isomerase/thioredoxin
MNAATVAIGIAAALLLIAAVAQGVVLVVLGRRNRGLRERVRILTARLDDAGPVVADARATGGVRVGSPAPPLRLPSVTGGVLDLERYHGRDVVVLFWSPTCPFSQRLLPELQAWEERMPVAAPALVVVSSGGVRVNLGTGLRSPIVTDPTGAVARSFGVAGTPTAVRVDALGRIASEVRSGSFAVLELLGPDVVGAVR